MTTPRSEHECTCRWYSVRIPGEPHIPEMWEAEPDPMCAVHFPPRWKVACINWSHADAPHALVYVNIGGEAHLERYFDTWADAWEWLSDHRTVLGRVLDSLYKAKRDYLAEVAP